MDINTLCCAVTADNLQLCKTILEAKVNPNTENDENNTPLFLAKNVEMVQLLIDFNVNINFNGHHKDGRLRKCTVLKNTDNKKIKELLESLSIPKS